jgi:type III secretory pathway component EscV
MNILMSHHSKQEQQKLRINKKHTIGLIIIAAYAILILSIPPLLIGKNISLILAVSTLVMVSVYILLALEIIHRSVLSLIGA